MTRRTAWLAACLAWIGLIVLGLAWELVLAPLRPGGSWLALKVVPLLLPLRGLLAGRRYTFQWSTLLVWAYFIEGIVRAMSDAGLSARLAAGEVVLTLGFATFAFLYLRQSRKAI